jgi:glyceraldehyde 3-phosphate dehydrogenase
MKEYAEGAMKGILLYTEEPLVSSDLRGNTHSSIFSAIDTVLVDDLVKVISWYDNEWGYSCRVADLVKFLADKGL